MGNHELQKNNVVAITGRIASELEFNHETFGERFFMAYVSIERTSGVEDIIPVVVSERLVDVSQNLVGEYVEIHGQYRSYNLRKDTGNHLILYVFAMEIEILSVDIDSPNNTIFLDGYICKPPVYRKTPLGREIADLLIAVNRPYGKSDYIPCICWGRNARYVGGLKVGEHIEVHGRIQSRVYAKRLPDGSSEERTAYEVSVSTLEVIEE